MPGSCGLTVCICRGRAPGSLFPLCIHQSGLQHCSLGRGWCRICFRGGTAQLRTVAYDLPRESSSAVSADGVDIMIAPPSAPLSYSPFPLPVAPSGYEVTRVLATNALRLFPHHAVSGHPTLATTEVFITGLRLVQHLVSACSCALLPGSFVCTTTLMTKGLDGVCSERHLHPARRCVCFCAMQWMHLP